MDNSQIDKNRSGQVGIWAIIITAVGSMLAAGITGYYTKSGATDVRLEVEKTERKADNLALVQRIAVNETKTAVSETRVDNLQKDVGEIKQDVKSLLKLLK